MIPCTVSAGNLQNALLTDAREMPIVNFRKFHITRKALTRQDNINGMSVWRPDVSHSW